MAKTDEGLHRLKVESLPRHAEQARQAQEREERVKEQATIANEMAKAERAKAQLAALEDHLASRQLEVAKVAALSVRERRRRHVTFSTGIECTVQAWMLGDREQWNTLTAAVGATRYIEADVNKVLQAFCGDRPLPLTREAILRHREFHSHTAGHAGSVPLALREGALARTPSSFGASPWVSYYFICVLRDTKEVERSC